MEITDARIVWKPWQRAKREGNKKKNNCEQKKIIPLIEYLKK